MIEKMKSVFITYGIPEQVVSDNVPYNSFEYKEFSQQWNFDPIYTTPKYAQANGFGEKGVAIAKGIVSKSEDWQYGLLQYRNTPLPALGVSPAQLLFGRILRTKLPITESQLQQQFINPSTILQKKKMLVTKEEHYYNRTAHNLPALQKEDKVLVQQIPKGPWQKGEVEAVNKNRSYLVHTDNDGYYLRNRRFIRKPARYHG